jgi:hypothetical protein
MIEPTPQLELPDITVPNSLYFQQASLLMLLFRFKGTRKVVASRLLIRDDFLAELLAHLPVLDSVYSGWRVNSVEIVSFQKGAFYYDEWPDAMKVVRAYRAAQGAEEEEEEDSLPGDASDELPEDEDAEEIEAA